MPRAHLALLLAALATAASAQPDTLRATLDLRPSIADGWFDPATETVGLRGDHASLSWDATRPASDPDGDGLYTLAVPVEIGADSVVVAFKVKVDGTGNPNDGWQAGQNHRVVLVRGVGAHVALAWEDEAEPPPPSFSGHVEVIHGVEGEGLGARDVFVYLPPGYAGSDARYPVLYLHDGQHVFDATEAGAEWGMDEAAEALIAAGEIEPLIIVGVVNTSARTFEYTPTAQTWTREMSRIGPPTAEGPLGALTGTYDSPDGPVTVRLHDDALEIQVPGADAFVPLAAGADGTFEVMGVALAFQRDESGDVSGLVASRPPDGGGADRYGALLTDVVKPLIDARYRTRPGPEDTGLGGASLGGLVTMHLGMTRPDVFGRLLVASPSVWWDERWILGAVAALAAPTGQPVWVDIGTAEGGSMVPDARSLRDALLARGWAPERVRYVEAEGAGHSETAWAARTPDMLRFLFPPADADRQP